MMNGFTKIEFGFIGKARKQLVRKIAEILETKVLYSGAPPYSYYFEGYDFSVGKYGVFMFDDKADRETLLKVFDGLEAAGYKVYDKLPSDWYKVEHEEEKVTKTIANVTETKPELSDYIVIELPLGEAKPEILAALLGSKATLIKEALGDNYLYTEYDYNGLPLTFTDTTVRFTWLKFGASPDVIEAWSVFFAQVVKFCQNAKTVRASDEGLGYNPRYQMYAFLRKIGLCGQASKVARGNILRSLPGDCSHATPESKERRKG